MLRLSGCQFKSEILIWQKNAAQPLLCGLFCGPLTDLETLFWQGLQQNWLENQIPDRILVALNLFYVDFHWNNFLTPWFVQLSIFVFEKCSTFEWCFFYKVKLIALKSCWDKLNQEFSVCWSISTKKCIISLRRIYFHDRFMIYVKIMSWLARTRVFDMLINPY